MEEASDTSIKASSSLCWEWSCMQWDIMYSLFGEMLACWVQPFEASG